MQLGEGATIKTTTVLRRWHCLAEQGQGIRVPRNIQKLMIAHIRQTEDYKKSFNQALKQAEAAALMDGSVTATMSIRAAEAFLGDGGEVEADAFVAKAMAAQMAGRHVAALVRLAPRLLAACSESQEFVRKLLNDESAFDKSELTRHVEKLEALMSEYTDGLTNPE